MNSFLKMAHTLRRYVAAIWAQVPFLGRLDYSDSAAWGRATLETVVSVVLSSAPVWVAVAALYWSNSESSLAAAATYVVKNGDLFLLSSGAVCPLIYTATVTYRATNKRFPLTGFPHGTWYILFAVVVLILSAVYLTLRSVQTHAPNSFSQFQPAGFTAVSWWCFGISTAVFFTVSIHRNVIDSGNPLLLNKSSEERFQGEWGQRNV